MVRGTTPAHVFVGVVSWYDLSEGKSGNVQSNAPKEIQIYMAVSLKYSGPQIVFYRCGSSVKVKAIFSNQ